MASKFAKTPSLLPPALNRDLTLRALEILSADAAGKLNLPNMLLYNFTNVDRSVLPSLAEQFSLIGDGWEFADTEQKQRDLLKSAIALHRIKGTPEAIYYCFGLFGFTSIGLEEGRIGRFYNSAIAHDGWSLYGGNGSQWADYRVVVYFLSMTFAQANAIKRMLKNWAPARCHLYQIVLKNQLFYNSAISHDGTYSYGAY